MAEPIVSFVVPCFNYGRFLPDCLAGIFSQAGDYEIEVIAIDDCSTDNTMEILEATSGRRMRVIKHEQNQGHVAAVNRGLLEARGRYVVRVDPDDRHRSHFLAATIPKLEAHPEVGLAFGAVALIDQHGNVTCEKVESDFGPGDRKGNELLRILENNYICAPTVVARREAWMSAWPVPAHLAFNDWYFNVMLARRYEFYYVDQIIADYRVHPQNHHSKIVLNRSEETSVLWVLDKIYSEVEADPTIERRKRLKRRRIYARQYLDFAEKYFWAKMNTDARRCYWSALRYRPQQLRSFGVWRRFLATILGRSAYELSKKCFYSVFRRRAPE